MTNMWHTAFVEQHIAQDGKWYVVRPNEFQGGQIYIELGPFNSKQSATQALDNAIRDCDQQNSVERYHGYLAENARM